MEIESAPCNVLQVRATRAGKQAGTGLTTKPEDKEPLRGRFDTGEQDQISFATQAPEVSQRKADVTAVCACSLRTQQRAETQPVIYELPPRRGSSFEMIDARHIPSGAINHQKVQHSLIGEFDPGSGRTLAACLTHASRAVRPFGVHERRTGE